MVAGGALALAVQESVNQYCALNALPLRRLRFMEVSYLSPCRGRVLINVTPIPHLEARQGRNRSSAYSPVEGVPDSFRVVLKAMKSSKAKGGIGKNAKPAKIYVQALVILY